MYGVTKPIPLQGNNLAESQHSMYRILGAVHPIPLGEASPLTIRCAALRSHLLFLQNATSRPCCPPARCRCCCARPAAPARWPALHRRLWYAAPGERLCPFFTHRPARAEQPALSDPLVLVAERRAGVGRLDAAKQRKGGRVPAVVFNQVRTRTRRLPPELSDAPPDSSTRRSCW